jgi:hypothetical protein
LAFKWLRDIANIRIHQTTQEQPLYRFKQELSQLQPYELLPQPVHLTMVKQERLPHCYEVINLQHSLTIYETILEGVV